MTTLLPEKSSKSMPCAVSSAVAVHAAWKAWLGLLRVFFVTTNKPQPRKENTVKKSNLLIIVSCCTLLVGCATAPMTSPTLDADAKTFAPAPGKANIYVYRDGRFTGSAVTYQAALDGRITGILAPNTFELLSVDPGSHTLSAVGEMRKVESQKFDAEAGRNYFYDFYAEMGWWQPVLCFKAMSDDEGRKAILKSKRAEADTY
jgi:hypothetical protein